MKFMNSFWYFFTTKAKQCENDIIRLRRVLDTLAKTRGSANNMKNYIKELKIRCKKAETESNSLLHKLIEKTTAVEKLKAKIGRGGALATLMQMQELISDSNILSNENNLLMESKKTKINAFGIKDVEIFSIFKMKKTSTIKNSLE